MVEWLVCAHSILGAVRMAVLDNIGKEVQEEDQLCWAAVSTMAVRAFPEDGEFRHPTQREIVIYRRAGIKSASDLNKAVTGTSPSLKSKLDKAQITCGGFGLCNALNPDGLHLYELTSTKVGAGKVLTPAHFEIEIDDRNRPVPIRWFYRGLRKTNGRFRNGEHALIVTGYKSATHELRIWDPWPALLNPDPLPGQHEKWIPYDTYVDPQNDQGMDAVAHHESDQYKLRRKGRKIPDDINYPPLAILPDAVGRSENPVDFQGDIPDLEKPIAEFLRGHVVRDSAGDAVHGPYVTGEPFPIIPLNTALLRKASRPESLLKPQTSAVVVPILKDGQVIDSFLMLRDKRGWRPGGYSNNKIAALLTEARDIHASGESPARSFYLVSIPELSTFFAAQGFSDRARLAPLNVHGEKRFVRGREALAAVVARIAGKPIDQPTPI